MECCNPTQEGLQEEKPGRANLAKNSLGQSQQKGKDGTRHELLSEWLWD